MRSGELIVTGEDCIELKLKSHPVKVIVAFKDDCKIVPCNPQHSDELNWDLEADPHHRHPVSGKKHTHKHTPFILNISWRVSGVRTIFWAVYF
jgi:hypothetical protein